MKMRPKAETPGSRYFCRKIFSGILLEKIGKNYATAYAYGAPIVGAGRNLITRTG
ncbi:hypothetical protein [Methylomonas sp. MK1]|uniref:hypothetical protein n=1 Tax=Methylomonas sp. MK1 TaxID=1131552 RepID=UPI00036FB288|nr:hypothetical protein [Methylomonas sp. MK1]